MDLWGASGIKMRTPRRQRIREAELRTAYSQCFSVLQKHLDSDIRIRGFPDNPQPIQIRVSNSAEYA